MWRSLLNLILTSITLETYAIALIDTTTRHRTYARNCVANIVEHNSSDDVEAADTPPAPICVLYWVEVRPDTKKRQVSRTTFSEQKNGNVHQTSDGDGNYKIGFRMCDNYNGGMQSCRLSKPNNRVSTGRLFTLRHVRDSSPTS